jgi:hypothetical protein
MALQYSVTLRNAQLDQIETIIGASPILNLRTGAAPADCATANSGSLIATINFSTPSDYFAAAGSGAVAKSGTWSNTSAGGTGTIQHFRFHASGGTCHMQGTCANSAADMNFDNNVVNAGQTITISTFQITRGNA